MPKEDAHGVISVLELSNVRRSQGITHPHINLWICKHCRCQTDYCKVSKWKRLLVIQIKDTKSCSGKRLAYWRKCEKKQIHIGKPKTWRIHIAEQEKNREGFRLIIVFACCLLHECRIGFPKMFFHSKSWGKVKRCHMREKWTFSSRKFKKRFSRNGVLPILNFHPIPHSIILRKNHVPVSFSCVDIVSCRFLIKNCKFNMMFNC